MKSFILILTTFVFSTFCHAQSNPVAKDDFLSLVKNHAGQVNLLRNDYDPDGDEIIMVRIINEFSNYLSFAISDSLVYVSPFEYVYGNFKIKYVIRKKNSFLFKDTATLYLTIENVPSKSYDSLHVNNIVAGINSSGDLFWDFYKPLFRVPKTDKVNSVFAANLWIGGYDDVGILHQAAQTYRQGQRIDYHAGPVANNYDAAYQSRYNRIWKIDRGMIANHIANWNSSGYKIDSTIFLWPGNGNVSNGELSMLAPFIDINKNGVYEPMQGDYPCIPGDQAILFLFNDDCVHTNAKSDSLRVEIQAMAYEYLSNDPVINNTLFFRYKIINRSANNYHDFYIGNWMDVDFGNAYDDYIGCVPSQNVYYVYNGTNNDLNGFGLDPPAMGVAFLSDSMSSFMYYNNDWSLKGNPSEAIHYYYYMTSRFKNGQKIRYGGDGFNDIWVNKDECFMYPDLPDLPPPAWSEVTSGNTPADRRAIGSIGPFELQSREERTIDIAYVWTRKPGYNHIENVYALLLDIIHVKNQIASNPPSCYTPTASIHSEIGIENLVEYYPSSIETSLFLRKSSFVNSEVSYSIISFDGKVIKAGILSEGQELIDFSQYEAGVYLIKAQSETAIQVEKVVKIR